VCFKEIEPVLSGTFKGIQLAGKSFRASTAQPQKGSRLIFLRSQRGKRRRKGMARRRATSPSRLSSSFNSVSACGCRGASVSPMLCGSRRVESVYRAKHGEKSKSGATFGGVGCVSHGP